MEANAATTSYRKPSAVGDDLRRFVALTVTLAVTDFKLRYFGSALGYFWSLARPVMFFGVIYLVFSEFANLGDQVPHYAVYILFSIVQWARIASPQDIFNNSDPLHVWRERMLDLYDAFARNVPVG